MTFSLELRTNTKLGTYFSPWPHNLDERCKQIQLLVAQTHLLSCINSLIASRTDGGTTKGVHGAAKLLVEGQDEELSVTDVTVTIYLNATLQTCHSHA
jgi:hypothetical protein